MRHATRVLLGAVLLTGCAKSIVVNTEFPRPLIETLPLTAAVHYTENFSNYVYVESVPNDVSWSIEIGAANIKLFDNIFSSLFENIVYIDGIAGAETEHPGLDVIIEPAIEAFEFSLPRQSRTEQYSVWIRYNLRVYKPDGGLISSWPVTAYGQSDSRKFKTGNSMAQATIMAMRDAAATIALEFPKEAKIKATLLEDKDHENP